MKKALLLFPIFATLSAAQSANNNNSAKAEEARACTSCHSARLIHTQRLSEKAWGKELDKMAGWGATFDRQLLLTYLSEEYSDKKSAADPSLTADGSKQHP